LRLLRVQRTLCRTAGKHGRQAIIPLQGAESWSTASVYQFAHHLDRLVAEQFARTTFEVCRIGLRRPKGGRSETAQFRPSDFLDSTFPFEGRRQSLRLTIQNSFLRPILREMHRVEHGERLSKSTPISAILSAHQAPQKPSLRADCGSLGMALAWTLTPSHVFRSGLEKIETESKPAFYYARRA